MKSPGGIVTPLAVFLCLVGLVAFAPSAAAEVPTVISITTGEPSPTGSTEVTFTITFDQPVEGLTEEEVQLNYASVSTALSITGGPEVYEITISNCYVTGPLSITIREGNIQNELGEFLETSASSPVIEIDAERAFLTELTPHGDEVGDFEPLIVDAVFSRPVYDFDFLDLYFISGTALEFSDITITGGPTEFTIELANPTRAGAFIFTLHPNHDIVDEYGRPLLGPFPEVPLTSHHSLPEFNGWSRESEDIVTADTVAVFAHFSHTVVGFGFEDYEITTDGVTFDEATLGDGTRDFTITITGLSGQGTLTITTSQVFLVSNAGGENLTLEEPVSLTIPVDLVAPGLEIVPAATEIKETGIAVFHLSFSEAVAGVDTDDFVPVPDGLSFTSFEITGEGDSYVATVGGFDGPGSITFSLSETAEITDIAGNAFVPYEDSYEVAVVIDEPALLSITPQQSAPTSAETVSFVAAFDQAVVGVHAEDFLISTDGSITISDASVSGTDDAWTLTLTGVEGLGNITVGLHPENGITNSRGRQLLPSGATATLAVDRAGPAITSFTTQQAAIQTGGSAVAVITFDQPALHVDIEDFIVSGSAAEGATLSILQLGLSFQLTLSPLNSTGTVNIAVNPDNDITDALGNPLAPGGAQVSFNVFVPGPRVLSITDPYSGPTNTAQPEFTIAFSEAIASLNLDAITVTAPGQSPTLALVSSSATLFTVRVQGLAGEGTVQLAIEAGANITNAQGHTVAAGATSDVVIFDRVAPTYTFAPIDIAVTQPLEPVRVQVNFSEPVRALRPQNLNFSVGGSSAGLSAEVTGSGATYEVQISGVAAEATGALTISVRPASVLDIAGNALGTGPAISLPIDFGAPQFLGFVPEDGRVPPGGHVAIRFSEPVNGLDASVFTIYPDFPLEIAPLGAGLYELRLPWEAGNNSALIVANLEDITDLNGNALTNPGEYAISAAMDETVPRWIGFAPEENTAITTGEPFRISLFFDEPVTLKNNAAAWIQVAAQGGATAMLDRIVQGEGREIILDIRATGASGAVGLHIDSDAFDGAANEIPEAVSMVETYVVDTTAPRVPLVTPLASVVQAGDSIAFDISTEGDGAHAVQASVNGGEAWLVELPEGEVSRFRFDTSAYDIGLASITTRLTDIHGRTVTYTTFDAFEIVGNTPAEDLVPPAVSSITFEDYDGAARTATFAVRFSEPVRGMGDGAEVLVRHNGTAHERVFVERIDDNDAAYRVHLLGMDGQGSTRVDIGPGNIRDYAGNRYVITRQGPVAFIDAQPPRVISFARATAGIHTGGDLVLPVSFDEPAFNFSAHDLLVESFGTAYARIVIEGGGTDYNIVVKGLRGNGWFRASLDADTAIADAVGNTTREAVTGPGVLVNTGIAALFEEPAAEAADALAMLEAFHTIDLNADGRLDWFELLLYQPELSPALINLIDSNDDGVIVVAELQRVYGGGIIHTADTDGDGAFELAELLRVIQLYNAGGYTCAPASILQEDGFATIAKNAAPGEVLCQPHALDYLDTGNSLSLSELLRAVQFFNAGGYSYCPGGSEDNFCANQPK
jgi:hypothetical protein